MHQTFEYTRLHAYFLKQKNARSKSQDVTFHIKCAKIVI